LAREDGGIAEHQETTRGLAATHSN
jgi:hypothetical protein